MCRTDRELARARALQFVRAWNHSSRRPCSVSTSKPASSCARRARRSSITCGRTRTISRRSCSRTCWRRSNRTRRWRRSACIFARRAAMTGRSPRSSSASIACCSHSRTVGASSASARMRFRCSSAAPPRSAKRGRAARSPGSSIVRTSPRSSRRTRAPAILIDNLHNGELELAETPGSGHFRIVEKLGGYGTMISENYRSGGVVTVLNTPWHDGEESVERKSWTRWVEECLASLAQLTSRPARPARSAKPASGRSRRRSRA